MTDYERGVADGRRLAAETIGILPGSEVWRLMVEPIGAGVQSLPAPAGDAHKPTQTGADVTVARTDRPDYARAVREATALVDHREHRPGCEADWSVCRCFGPAAEPTQKGADHG